MIRILIADDHDVVREGLKLIASETTDILVADEASSGQEALDKALKNDYDVIVLDITLSDRSGLDVLKELISMKPDAHVLVLSMHPEEQYALRVLRAGASGYLSKRTAGDELAKAIRVVASGRKFLTSAVSEKLASVLESTIKKEPHELLSDREYQVMCLQASGKTMRDIAEELILSINTVKTYRARILEKMGLRNNAELVRYAIEHHLLD